MSLRDDLELAGELAEFAKRARPRRRAKPERGRFPYVWERDHRPPGRRGKRLRVTGRGPTADTAQVEFEDGWRGVVARAGMTRDGR